MRLVHLSICAVLVLIPETGMSADFKLVDDSVLQDAIESADGKGVRITEVKAHYPKDSWKMKHITWGVLNPDGGLSIVMLSPQARAFRTAAHAERNFITLDSSSFSADQFNDGVLLSVVGVEKEKMFSKGKLVRVERIVCLTANKEKVDPLWTHVDTTFLSNPIGGSSFATDIEAVFPLSIIKGGGDLRFYLFCEGRDRKECKFKSKELKKLR